MKTAKLLLYCPDRPGILAEVTDFITVNKGNIIYLDQHVDHVENIFFMKRSKIISKRCMHRSTACISACISRT